MDEDVAQYLILVNKALLDGLKVAVFTLEKVDEISRERRQTTIDELNALITEGEKVYKKKSTEH